MRWYQMDEDLSRTKWIAHCLQLGPLYRYVIVLQTGMTAKKSRDPLDFDLLYHQQSDVCMLRLFESFMESAPQVVLQLYIMVATNEENFFTGISATVSLVSLCWAIAVYSRIHRRVREDKKVVSWPGVLLQAVWRIGMISSRVVALVLFATVFKAYVFLVITIHWFVMAVWVFLQNTDFCSSWFEERLFNAVIAVVYIFCFFNLKEGTSRYRVFIFYSVIFVENVFCLILWNFSAVRKGIYTEIGFTIVFGGFFVGVTSMVLYYRYLHPHSSVGCCSRGDTSKHQPCLKHEDIWNISKGRGLEAEISPRSPTPSPCVGSVVNHQSALALPISQFTTPVSRPLSPETKMLSSVTYHDETSHIGGDERQLKGLQRTQSDSCILYHDDASKSYGMSLAKSVNGLVFAESSDTNSTSIWMDQFARERKSLTRDFFNFLSPDDLPIGVDLVNRVSGQCASAEVANIPDSALSREHERKPQSLLRVDSVSKKLLKGGADRKMHRSFRRQLRFEDKGENDGTVGVTRLQRESHNTPKGTATNDSKKIGILGTSKDLLKLPVDNVKAKMKVFEALRLSNSNISDSSPLRGKEKMGTVTSAGNKRSLNEESKIANSQAMSDAGLVKVNSAALKPGIQSIGHKLSMGSHGNTMTPEPNSSEAMKNLAAKNAGNFREEPESALRINDITQKSQPTTHQRYHSAEASALSFKRSGQHEITGVKCQSGNSTLEEKVPVRGNELGLNKSKLPTLGGESTKSGVDICRNSGTCDSIPHLKVSKPVILPEVQPAPGQFGKDKNEEAGIECRHENTDNILSRQTSPLSEIQSGKPERPLKYKQSSDAGKENQRCKPRKSFGNVKIEDIKESMTNTPKTELKKSRRSFNRIPTDIVASRVSRLMSTPENP
ncbi:hypothetical protein BSL78_27223 [Apostichopus japonicus]|uniref:XK-related protein n=1 Tax=Stichopus japonicus TaxID=307972 RepID=A0A2G8JJN3_STIJA|nr:hypothetical protein BSL78_27223 [Apostichopus japonicus]